MAQKTEKDLVLFVHAKCKGSQEAVALLNGSSLNASVEVQNIANVPARMLPEYVTGVPVIVDLKQRSVYRGSECVNFLQNKIKNGIPAYGGGPSAGYGSFEDGSGLGGTGFASVGVSDQLSGPSFEEEQQHMDVTKYRAMRSKMLPTHSK